MPTSSEIKTYMDSLSEFVFDLSKSSSKRIAIILPNFMSVDVFKTSYIKNKQAGNLNAALFMPAILTIDQYIHQVSPEKSAGDILQHEQVLLMTSIIKSYKITEYRAIDAISIARQVIDIYWRLKRNSISYDEINAWVDEDLAQHWWATSEFLDYCFRNYDLVISSHSSKRTDIKPNSEMIFIFAGLLDGFAKDYEIIEAQTGIEKYIILPPVDSEKIDDKEYSYLRKNYVGFVESPITSLRGVLARRGNLMSYTSKPHGITTPMLAWARDDVLRVSKTYLEFYDIFEEVEYLVHRIENRKSNISIITNNDFLKELICYQLSLSNIEYNSSFGTPYTEFLEVELLLNLAKLKSNNDIVNFIALLKSRILNNDREIENFINQLNNSNRFYENFEAAITNNEIETSDYLQDIFALLKSWLDYEGTNFVEIFTFQIKIFELLYSKANLSSYKNSAEKFKSYIRDIQNLKIQEYHVDTEDYSEYLNKIFAQKYTKPFNRDASVYIITPDDSLLIDSFEVIFADFNHDSYIQSSNDNVWLSNKILKKLDLYNESDQFDKLLYLISSKIHSCNVTFTRSKYQQGVLQEKCTLLDFIDNTQFITPEPIRKPLENISECNIVLNSLSLPTTLYPTNIEQLILDPYGFMAKKVLGLRKKKDALAIPENSDFGTVVHELIERIETTPNIAHEQIIGDILLCGGYDSKIKSLWIKALLSIAAYISQSNKNVFQAQGKIFSEIEGGCKIHLTTREINLKAIADRIEVYPDKVRIIDYKTGAHASKKDVSIGKAPQLIVEAIILEQGGFDVGNILGKPIELVYIKVNSKEPFLDETVINITDEELQEHKEAMIKFLEYYYGKAELSISPNYITENWKPNYDDYKHFRRV